MNQRRTFRCESYLGLARARDSVAMHKSAKTMIDKAHALDTEDPDIQKYWIRTLQRPDRITYYEAYLAGDHKLDAEERTECNAICRT